MGTAIRQMDPAENEFLAALEKKSGKPNHFYRTMANRPELAVDLNCHNIQDEA